MKKAIQLLSIMKVSKMVLLLKAEKQKTIHLKSVLTHLSLDLEEGLVGMAAGEEKEINLTFPKEYHAADLAGAEVVFKVKVHEIKAKGFT